jgi:hypothetical protein
MKKLSRVLCVLLLVAFLMPPIASKSLIGTVFAQSCSDCVSNGFQYMYSNEGFVPQCVGPCTAQACVARWDYYEENCFREGYWDGPYITECGFYFNTYQCCYTC